MSKNSIKVLIAGIGGASLGTEILKSLTVTKRYQIFGCDISEHAYGHYQPQFTETFLIDKKKYAEKILEICVKRNIQAVIPGGEEPLLLLINFIKEFQKEEIHLATNSPEVVALCSDKKKLFHALKNYSFRIPNTISVEKIEDFKEFSFPCIIKPSLESGGSRFVFIASNNEEAKVYFRYLINNNQQPIVQEYIPADNGEFTVGVLSSIEGNIIGSIAMKRIFNAKLSVSVKTNSGLISSGYSQGLIDDFTDIREQSETIAKTIRSKGPINIQGRLLGKTFIPFEINPRFSASTFLRTMSGFNEIDIHLRSVLNGEIIKQGPIKSGFYLRSLDEIFVEKGKVKN